MDTPFGRLAGALVLAALLVGLYALISASPSGSDPQATGKFQLKKPPQLTGEVLEGTGI